MIENDSVETQGKAVAKGIPASVQKKIEHKDYKLAMDGEKVEDVKPMANVSGIRIQKHQLETRLISKTPYDDKRYVTKDKFSTLSRHRQVENCKFGKNPTCILVLMRIHIWMLLVKSCLMYC